MRVCYVVELIYPMIIHVAPSLPLNWSPSLMQTHASSHVIKSGVLIVVIAET